MKKTLILVPDLNLPGGVTSAAPPQLEVLLAGRIEGSHFVEVYAGQSLAGLRLVGTASFTNFQNAKVNVNLLWTDVAASGGAAAASPHPRTGVRR